MTQTKTCTSCNEQKDLEYFYKHKAGKLGYKAQCKECENSNNRLKYKTKKFLGLKYIKTKKDTVQKNNLKNNFGLTLEQYNEILEKQNYCCAICQRHQSEYDKNFAVDHSNSDNEFVSKGSIRGLLCTDCNLNLVSYRVDPNIFERAAKYVKQFTGLFVPERNNID